jgi:Holliday junction resolvasome RuvABC DNA-binding subunit
VPASDASGEEHVVARDALVELGWSLLDAERVLADVDPDLSPEERVRLALKKAA